MITGSSLEEKNPLEIIDLYNQRRTSEQLFDEIKNDYKLDHPPFSDLQYNTAHFIICALSCVLVDLFKQWVCKQEPGIIIEKVRIKQLIFQLISIPGKILRHARREYYKLYTKDKRLRRLFTEIA